MASEVQTITTVWCDVCLLKDSNRVEASWSSVVTINTITRHLDLCEEHTESIIGQLPGVLESYGAKLDAKPKMVGSQQPTCPKCKTEFFSRSALVAHARNVHNATLTELEDAAGLPRSGSGRSNIHVCSICGRTTMGGQGLSAHMRSAHPDEAKQAS